MHHHLGVFVLRFPQETFLNLQVPLFGQDRKVQGENKKRHGSSAPIVFCLARILEKKNYMQIWKPSSFDWTIWRTFCWVFFTWSIIPLSKWLVTPMYKPFKPFGRWTTQLEDLLTMNHWNSSWNGPPSMSYLQNCWNGWNMLGFGLWKVVFYLDVSTHNDPEWQNAKYLFILRASLSVTLRICSIPPLHHVLISFLRYSKLVFVLFPTQFFLPNYFRMFYFRILTSKWLLQLFQCYNVLLS